MSFPNPAGFYLKLTPETEAEITTLGYEGLSLLIHEVSKLNFRESKSFISHDLSDSSDYEILWLSKSDRIALLRWLTERLSFLVLTPITVSHAATTT